MENYLYTTEAMKQYLSHLNPGGYLVFLLHESADLTRMFNTLVAALQESGKSFEEAKRHILAVNNHPPSPNPLHHVEEPLLIFRKSPFSEVECEQMVRAALGSGFTPLFAPYLHEGGIFGLLSQGRLWVEKFQFESNLNFTPVNDNSPFFFNFSKGAPSSLKSLLTVFLILALFLFILYLTPRKQKQLNPGRKSTLSFLFYFFLLGLAFMLVEISLIERFMLFLGTLLCLCPQFCFLYF